MCVYACVCMFERDVSGGGRLDVKEPTSQQTTN